MFVPSIISDVVLGEPEMRFFEDLVQHEMWRGAVAGFVVGLGCFLAMAGLAVVGWRCYQRGSWAGMVACVVLALVAGAFLYPVAPSRFAMAHNEEVERIVPGMLLGVLAGLGAGVGILVWRLKRSGGIVISSRGERSSTVIRWRR